MDSMPSIRARGLPCPKPAEGMREGALLALACLLTLLGTRLDAAPTIRFGRLSVEQGLSQSTVQAILQDHDGFLWFGTEEGLNRYDGYSFTVFKHDAKNPASLPQDRVSSLHEDAQQRLWVGTDGGLSLFDRQSETFASVPGLNGRVTGFAEYPDGTLWVGVEGAGVFARNPITGAFVVHPPAENDPGSFASWVPSALLRDHSGRLWIGTKDAGLDMSTATGSAPTRFAHYRHDPRDPRSLSHDEIWGLAESPSGEIWVATYGGGLNVLDPATGRFRHYRHDAKDPKSLGTDLATTVFVDASGTIWVGTDGAGIQKYDPATDGFHALRHDERDPGSLSQDVIRSFGEDRQGQLWVGTYLAGADVLRTTRHRFGYFTQDPNEPTSLPDPNVASLLEDAQGHVWVGTARGWLLLFDRATGVFARRQLAPALPGALSLYQDRRGWYWIGSYRGGLGSFDPDRGVIAVYRHRHGDATSLSNDEVWTIAEDQAGALWLGTNDGVDRFDPLAGVVTAHFDTPSADATANAGTRALLVDRTGNVWVGTIDGLYKIASGATRIAPVSPGDPSLGRDGVVAMHEDRHGTIWLGTLGGGLKSLDPDTGALHVYKAFPSNSIYGIEEDSTGRLWLSTNHGLSRFDPQTRRSDNFDLSNGLQSLQFSLGAHARLRDGHLLFGSVEGLYDFDPDAIQPDPLVPHVILTAVRVFNEPLKLASALPTLREITLSYRDKVFSVEFAALDYSVPRHNQYAYSMEGFSKQWLQLGSKREVTFTNLDPGRYTLRVKASNNDGTWSDEAPALLTIVITPPLWGTAWFRITAFVLVMALLLTAHRFRVRRLTAQLVERQRSELALRQSEEEGRHTVSVLQSTLESTADGILVVDHAGCVVAFNQRFAQLLRIPPGTLLFRDRATPLMQFTGQLHHPEQFSERIRQLDSELDAESFDLLEFDDGRVLECYSLPHRLDGEAVGRVWSFRDITERRRAEATVEFQAYHDALTGLPNRLLLEDRLAQALVHAQRHKSPLAVIFLDIDHFKLINDTLGHAVGDKLLRAVAGRLRATLRADDTVARLGGDEFTLLFTELARDDDAARTAEKVLDAFSAPFAVDGHELYVTASIGVALFPNDGEDPDTLLRNADAAMYRAKEAGRNNYQLCTPGMNVRALERMTLERALRRALDRDELVLHYQPFVSLASGQIVGVEALVRWNHPERGLLLPGTFIPVAEESRLIVPLGEWVLATASRQLTAWHREGFSGLRMAVNISARQLQQQSLLKVVEAAVATSGAPAGCLELEITESAAMQNLEWTKSLLHALREMGVRISIDDFGTGQSSLSYLKHFPLSTLKIDRSFVRDIAVDPDDEAIVRAVIALAHILKLTVVAEGVETPEQHAFLQNAGCEEGQGHFFSRPLPAAALQPRLEADTPRTPSEPAPSTG
jgi:diguanylate cyclase (GGDEF)-like protein/PAS domain S-box-containing protein